MKFVIDGKRCKAAKYSQGKQDYPSHFSDIQRITLIVFDDFIFLDEAAMLIT